MRYFRMTARLVGAALAALALLPAAAQAAALDPAEALLRLGRRPSTRRRPEALDLGGSGFTPGALVDVAVDGTSARTASQADAAGNLPGAGPQRPTRRRGQRPFTLTATERATRPTRSRDLARRPR